jgi:hypothetical protein
MKDTRYRKEIRHTSQPEKKVNELVTHAIILDSLILAYAQFMILLTELNKGLSI